MFPLFLFCVWALVIAVEAFEKFADNQPGGVSIFPGIPFMPLMAWGIAVLLDFIYPMLGYYAVGGLHVVLATWSLFVAAKCAYRMKHKKRG